MDTEYDFGPAVGFPMSTDDWRGVMDTFGMQWDFGEVTEVKAIHSDRGNRAMPVLTRLLADNSGAAITCGYDDVRFGFIPPESATLTYVHMDYEGRPATTATCFVDDNGLIEPNHELIPEDGSFEELVDHDAAKIEYVPLNPGGHGQWPDEDGSGIRLGFLQLAGLFDGSNLSVTLPGDDDYLVEHVFCTDVEDLYSPVNVVSGVIRSSERRVNEITGLPFWHLRVAFGGSQVFHCCAPAGTDLGDGVNLGLREENNPFPVGSVINGTLLFVGRFLPVEWGGYLAASETYSPMALDKSLWPDGPTLQGGLASATSIACVERNWDFTEDFTEGYVKSDMAGCLGMNAREYQDVMFPLVFRNVHSMWASQNLLDINPESDEVTEATATLSVVKPIHTLGSGVSCLIGMALPGNSWGIGVLVDPNLSEISRVYAAVDVVLFRDRGEFREEFLEPDYSAGDANTESYGESRIAAVKAQYPRLHQNSFTDTLFVSVTARLDTGDVTIVLPCPEWLAEIAVESGVGSIEVARALQLLHGRYLVGRFDDCTLQFDAGSSFLKEFDGEVRLRTPESHEVQRKQRDNWNIRQCHRNPEINLNASAVAELDEVGIVSVVRLMSLLQVGPTNLNFRLSEIYNYLGINIYSVGHGNYRIERDSDEAQWVVWTDYVVNTANAADTRSETSSDPSLGDYLTEDDNLDSHIELLEQAIFNNQKVSMLYGDRDDEPTVRTIHPVRIVNLNHLYLVAWDELREAWRTFRVQRIKMCSLLDEYFPSIEAPLPMEMTLEEYEYLREKFGEDADTATLFVAWTIWFRA